MKLVSLLLLSAVSAIHLREDPPAEKDADAGGISFDETARPATDWGIDKNGGFNAGTAFQIKSRMDSNKVLYVERTPIVDQSVGLGAMGPHSNQNDLKIRAPQGTREEMFVFDEKTQSIRSAQAYDKVLSFEKESLAAGDNTVIKPFSNADNQHMHYLKGTYQIANDKAKNMCLQSAGNDEGSTVKAAACDNKKMSQKWYPQYWYQANGPHWWRQENV